MENRPTIPPHTRYLVPGECIYVGDLIFVPETGWTPVDYSIGREVVKAEYVCRPMRLDYNKCYKCGKAVYSTTGLCPDCLTLPADTGTTSVVGVNPKDAVAAAKPDLSLVPPALVIWVAKCMEDGARKYSKANWRDEDKKVRMTVYLSAALRHLMALNDGEDCASDTGLPHAAHAAASMGIILDALACGTLIDDRSRPGPAAKLLEQLTEKTK